MRVPTPKKGQRCPANCLELVAVARGFGHAVAFPIGFLNGFGRTILVYAAFLDHNVMMFLFGTQDAGTGGTDMKANCTVNVLQNRAPVWILGIIAA